MLLDDMLIDVKTTATLRIRTEDWRQLVGYAALNAHVRLAKPNEGAKARRRAKVKPKKGLQRSRPRGRLSASDPVSDAVALPIGATRSISCKL